MLDFYKNKRVFITGHTGFKGSWLSKMLLEAGADVTGYSLLPPTNPSLFELIKLNKNMNSIIGDVRDLDLLKKSINHAKPDIVLHLAAQPIVRDSYRLPAETYEINVMGTVHILESIRNNDHVKSFVNVTTDKVYENKEWHWGYREQDNLCGYDPYSNSKSCSELVTQSFRNSFFKDNDIAISTARAGNVIGGGDFANDRLIPDCVKAILEDRTIIVRNQYAIRPWQHVLEPLSGYLLLAQKQYEDKLFASSYNFGPEDKDCMDVMHVVMDFCSEWGEKAKWEYIPDNGLHEATFLKLDCSKARGVLDWKPKWNLKTAIHQTVAFYKCYAQKEDLDQCMRKQISEYDGNTLNTEG